MKPYYGLLYDIKCLETPHNHLCVYGRTHQHPVYAGGTMHTSKVVHIDIYSDGYAELETMNSRYGVMGDNLIHLQNCLEAHTFADLTLAHIKND